MIRLAQQFAPVLLLVIGPTSADGADFFVTSAADVTTAMQSAGPGDTLVMANGDWTDQHIRFEGVGNAASPITLRAETPGQVILNGDSRLSISGDWLVVDGLHFDGGALGAGQHIVEFRGNRGEATNSRFTNSAISNYNPASIDTRYFWVSLYGQDNRVDHNLFEGHDHSGVSVVVWRNDDAADHHRIDANHFADRPEGNGNGFETIRIGTSTQSLSDSFTTVENNLFERVDGEIEIISGKSGSNTYRYNTFRESSGTLTLRHGNDARVEGNFFLGMRKDGSGGVRVIGERHVVTNNYFQGLDGRADGAISISAGVSNSELNEYFQVRDAVIVHNTIVDVHEAAVTFDHGFDPVGRPLLAENVTVANNLVFSTQDPLFEGNMGSGWTWDGNIAFGQSLGPVAGNPGVTAVNPQLALWGDGLWRPTPTSPAIDGAAAGYSAFVPDDMDGQPRIGLADAGSDEFASSVITRRPLVAGDVGPEWLSTAPDLPSGGCFTDGCAIQAEDYVFALDPDANARVWQIVDTPDALGKRSLRAPAGETVDLSSELHDTIAVYELEFQQPGVYTAYYRGRGFDSSTDSLYVPDDFGVEPDVSEVLSSDGVYRWETGETFEIAAPHVGIPLEFLIGMREQFADFDAFVLHLDSDLTADELNLLFAAQRLEADFDKDGDVDGDDFLAWQTGFGIPSDAHRADGDADDDGDVDGDDFLVWQNQFGSTVGNAAVSVVPEPGAVGMAASLVGMSAVFLAVKPRRSITA